MGGKERVRRQARQEVGEAQKNPMYDTLFSKILEISRARAETSTENTATVAFQMPPDQSIISVTVNPSFADEHGRPVFLTVDAYVDGLHVQQVSARATWNPLDVPTSEIDSATVGVGRRRFDTESLARMGIVAMKSLLVDEAREEGSDPTTAQPPKYLN